MKKYNTRKWLNKDIDGTAYIRIDEDEIKIADCSKIITLDFSLWDSQANKDIDNIEYKIDTLYEEIKKYRQFIKRKIKKARKDKEL